MKTIKEKFNQIDRQKVKKVAKELATHIAMGVVVTVVVRYSADAIMRKFDEKAIEIAES